MFEKRKRRKAAEHRFEVAITDEWARRGVVPRFYEPDPRARDALQEALRGAGLPVPGEPEYTRLVVEVMAAAEGQLSPEDRQLINS